METVKLTLNKIVYGTFTVGHVVLVGLVSLVALAYYKKK